jgi:hypothetical protein
MSLTGLELAVPADGRPQTHALDHAATGIGYLEGPSFKFQARCPIFWGFVGYPESLQADAAIIERP